MLSENSSTPISGYVQCHNMSLCIKKRFAVLSGFDILLEQSENDNTGRKKLVRGC